MGQTTLYGVIIYSGQGNLVFASLKHWERTGFAVGTTTYFASVEIPHLHGVTWPFTAATLRCSDVLQTTDYRVQYSVRRGDATVLLAVVVRDVDCNPSIPAILPSQAIGVAHPRPTAYYGCLGLSEVLVALAH